MITWRDRSTMTDEVGRYVQGVSTRKGEAITEEVCGHTFSASTISPINASLYGVLRRFAERRLDEAYPSLRLDARYEKVRLDGVIRTRRSSWRSDQWGRPAPSARRGAVEPGVGFELGDVRHGPEGSRPARGRVRRLQRRRRAEAGCCEAAARGGLATLLRGAVEQSVSEARHVQDHVVAAAGGSVRCVWS